MGEAPLTRRRGNTRIFLAHFGAFLFVVLAAYWLRRIKLEPDAILQGYLQVISGLLALFLPRLPSFASRELRTAFH